MYREEKLINTDALSHRWGEILDGIDYRLGVFALAALVAVGVYGVLKMAPVAIVAFYVFGLLGLLVAARMGITERRVFMVVFSLNVLFTLAQYMILMHRYGTPYATGGSDDLTFERQAQVVATSVGAFDYAGAVRLAGNTTKSYIYLLSWLYRLSTPFGGFDTLVPRLLNALLLALVAVLVFRIARDHLGLRHRTSFVAALVTGLFPVSMLVSAHTFRDPAVTFMVVLLTYLWSGALSPSLRRMVGLVLITIFLLAVMRDMRERMAQLTVLLVLFAFLEANASNRRLRIVLTVFFLGFLAGAILEMLRVIDLIPSFDWRWIIGQVNRYTQLRIASNEGGLTEAIFRAPLPLAVFGRLVLLSITPLPMLSSEPERNFLSLGTVAQILALPFVVLGAWYMIRRRKGLAYLLALVTLFLSVALVTFTSRHISMFAPFGILVCAYGYEYYHPRGKGMRWVYLALYFIFIAAFLTYLAFKQQ